MIGGKRIWGHGAQQYLATIRLLISKMSFMKDIIADKSLIISRMICL